MEAPIFLVTKLSRPRISRYHLPRPHLTEILQEGLGRRLTTLIAAAGHGKTCTLGHFLAQAALPYLWVQLDAADSDLRTFAGYLAHGIERELLGTTGPSRSGELASSVQEILPALVSDLNQSAGDVAIVLDDFHLVERDSPVVQLMAGLLQYCGERVHFFICSRTPLPFSTARLKVIQEAVEITEEDLRFTPVEVLAFMKEMAGMDLDEQQLDQICHLTEGWSAALVLLAAGWRRRGSSEMNLGASLPPDLFTYLADELFRTLPPNIQRFMEESSILDVCSPGICDAVLERQDSASVLQQILNSNLLLTQLGAESFRYHHLLQRFLQDRLRLRDSGHSFRRLHKLAGDWHMAREQPEEAVRYYLRGEWLKEAAGLVEELAPLWLRTNKLERLRGLLAYLPTETKEEYPWISLCEARYSMNAGQPDAAMGQARLALRSFEAKSDARGMVQAYSLMGEILTNRQQFDAARKAYEDAAGLLQPEFLYEEGLLFQRRASLELKVKGPGPVPEEYFRRSLSIFIELGDLYMEAHVSDLLGMVREYLGDFGSGLRLHERAAEISLSLGEQPYEVGVNLAWGYALAGRFQDAVKIDEPMVASSSRKLRRMFAALQLVYIYTRLGEFAKASAIAQTANALTEEMGHGESRISLIAYLAGMYRLSGQFQAAVQYANEAMQLVKNLDRANLHVRPVMETALLHLFHTGNAAAASRLAERALARLSSGDSHPFERMMLTLIRAVAEFRQTRTESRPEAVRILQEAMAECSRRGYEFFALHEWPLALSVVVYSLAYGVHTELCLQIIGMMDESLPGGVIHGGIILAEAEARLVPAAWHALPDQESRERFSKLLTPGDRRRVVSLATGPAPVRIQCLGPVGVTVGTESVDSRSLKKRKSAQVLVLLLIQDGPFPREQLVEMLWPDLDPQAADTSLRVSLHHLRRLLEPHLGGRSKSRYIQSEGGLIWFSRHSEVQADLDRFREELAQAGEWLAKGDHTQAARGYEAAARTYRGDLAADEPYCEALDDLRNALRERFSQSLDWLADHYWQEAQDPPRAILALKQRLGLDPAHEAAHQALMRIYLEIGQVSAARQQYATCREALSEHLGVQPSRATESLLQLALTMENEALPVSDGLRRRTQGKR